ncbi:3-isopropylmalate dehydratase large subunit [Sorangium cellulosum]|uniref:3-isopropylmalate dehydratase large subunit n=1 Tax=Sorangium cellulosum TaxID=56 RepID=A0A4P2Q1L3_SORCE|nr:aconitase family protein [Sorangium cellulosum]AUX23155.1 3-isopropylmalate dehydratase large subunit [Sorangium cellulosum]
MPQKILAGRATDPQLRGDLVQVKVDQVILSRAPSRALAEAIATGMKKTPVEVAVAYDGTCVADASSLRDIDEGSPHSVSPEFPSYNIPIARPGIGFPAPVHLERFAAPARLALTDDPRLATVGGIGMLALVVSPSQLGQALATGSAWLRPPRSVQIHLSGKVRPFVCARDVALELLRRNLDEIVRRIEGEHHAPVILEFAGPSARLLSVGDRAVLCGIAPQVGAAAALFVSDEKTEVFLRDQRRSKAHRALVPDPGAPCEEVVSIDLGTVDPLLMDEEGVVRPVRDLAGKPVSQVVLGGDSGVTLRDMLAAALLLKSKRVPSRLDLLVAPPSRQVLEVLAQSGALVDLVATGARIVEPDRRVVTSEIYPPPPGGVSLRTADPEPRIAGAPAFVVASAETLAYAVATGAVGDPRSFKRPVRVTVPRALPTDDVLILRDKKGEQVSSKKPPTAPPAVPWRGPLTLDVLAGVPKANGRATIGARARKAPAAVVAAAPAADEIAQVAPAADEKAQAAPAADEKAQAAPAEGKATGGLALVLSTLDEVRAVAERATDLQAVRAVVAPFVPSTAVSAFASEGIATFLVGADALGSIKEQKSVELPAPAQWGDRVAAVFGSERVEVAWLATGLERSWTHAGTVRQPSGASKPAR